MPADSVRVLLVDDDPDLLAMLALHVEALDISCSTALSGAEALVRATEQQPDLIVLDLMMPEMDGFETLQALKELPGMDEVPVLFLSSQAEEEQILRAFHLGADDYVTKPFQAKAVSARIKIAAVRFHKRRQENPELLAGQYIQERYQIIRELGRGGLGVVYLASDTTIGELRAVKTVHFAYQGKEKARGRFLRESQATKTIQHPHIVAFFGAGEHKGNPFYVMPYLGGGSLKDLLDEGPLRFDLALRYMADIADGVHCAHTKGILHRDLKAENILFSVDREPIVTDFSLAYALDGDKESRITGTGMIAGTPRNMSPEQVIPGRPLDARSDVFSLGLMLYEMLTGEGLFEGIAPMECMARLLTEDLGLPAKTAAMLPPSVAAICESALRRHVGERCESAALFAQGCRDALNESQLRSSS